MDNETREEIVQTLDENIKSMSLEISVNSIVNWIMSDIVGLLKDYKNEVKSAEDLAVGYLLGYLSRNAHGIIADMKMRKKIDPILKSPEDKSKMVDTNKIHKVYISVSKSEIKVVREMLKARLPMIREEVIKALNV
jgi:hypothetical protein